MWKKATVGALAAAAIVGTAGFAVARASGTTVEGAAQVAAAATGTPTPSASDGTATTAVPAKPAKPAKGDKAGDRALARQILGRLADFEHAEWVTKDDNAATVTHDAILGTVTAVSASSISVRADDGTAMTFAVNADTKVRQRAKGQGSDASIGDVTVGRKVLVAGTKTPQLTATLVQSRA